MVKDITKREFDFSDKDFNSIVNIVKEKTGITLASHKRNMVYGRLAKRLRELGFDTFSQYIAYLNDVKGEEETGNFVNAITTNLTSFFREGHHFDHLKSYLRGIVASNPAKKRIRIWSSASSSGQEPYSIAMTVMEAMPNIKQWDVKILATDIDTGMLEKCKAGEYKADMLEDIPAEYRKKYVVESSKDGTIMMADSLKQLLTFKPLNLLHAFPMKGPFDAVFCRNVVIYFDKPTQKDLFNRIAGILKPDGLLYLGHSESLFKVSDRFELEARTTYKRIS